MQDTWRIKDLLEWTTRYFSEKGLSEPRLEAEVLLARVLKKDRVYLYTSYEAPVNREEREKYKAYIKRRVKGEPTAYILGYKEFMSLDFMVTPDVLIPRPDTEILVETAIGIARGLEKVSICDVGTGSGAIAVSLAYYLKHAEVSAVDISVKALEIARQNAQMYGVKIDFYTGDLLNPLKGQGKFDIITANLPYISDSEFERLEPGVKDYEPVTALLVPGDGLDMYRRLLPEALGMLNDGGYILFEIGYEQGEKARQMMQDFTDVEIIKDLGGRDRIVKARKG